MLGVQARGPSRLQPGGQGSGPDPEEPPDPQPVAPHPALSQHGGHLQRVTVLSRGRSLDVSVAYKLVLIFSFFFINASFTIAKVEWQTGRQAGRQAGRQPLCNCVL